MSEKMIGRVLNGRYKIVERIGIGGMAEVYKAQDEVLGRNVAVKLMLPQYAADPSFTQRFKQEAASAANLQSPYIVNVYDWGHDGEDYFIIMEFVRGSDLKSAINNRGHINQRKVAEIGAQVCQALSVAHNQDIIHRDIKPQNIMIQPDGNIKVMDFGIARAKNSVKEKTSSVLGTAHYISPEQAQGKDLTAASDIYSLGVVLYEAVTGQVPFDGPDAVSVAMKQVNEQPVPPSVIRPGVDPNLEKIILRAMAKNPMERFATAREMRGALMGYLTGRMPTSFTQQQTAVIAPVVAPISGGTSVMPVVPAKAGTNQSNNYHAADDSKKKMSGKKKAGIVIGVIAVIAIIAAIVFVTSSSGSGKTVPDVTNMTLSEATVAIEDAGFSVGTVTSVYDSKVESGKVISQDPVGGVKRDASTKINLKLSQGTEEVTVPDLTGMTVDEAKKAIELVGLTPKAGTPQSSDTVEEDHVMSQNPTAGSKLAKGGVVEYVVSKGAEEVSVPYVVGYGEYSATATLNSAGFEVNVAYQYSDTVSEGLVIYQNPNSGTKLAKGKTVTITVSNGQDPSKKQVSVPNVVGQSVSSATSTLQNAGFSVSVSGSGSTVDSQSPSGGSKANSGETVTIYAY